MAQLKHERSQSQNNRARYSQQNIGGQGLFRPQTAIIKKQI